MSDPRRFVHIAVRNREPFMVVSGDVVVRDGDGLTFVTAPRGANRRTLEQEVERVTKLQAATAPAQFEEL